MIINSIKDYLNNTGFVDIRVNVSGIYLLQKKENQMVNVIALFDCQTEAIMNEEQYDNIKKQLKRNLEDRLGVRVNIQTILFSDNVNLLRSINGDDRESWIINTEDNTLIIYENQRSDFLNVKTGIESILDNERYTETEYNREFYENKYEPQRRELSRYFSKYNTFIIIINVLVFLIMDSGVLKTSNNYLISDGALYWPVVIYDHQYYRLFTYMFLHGGFSHLVNNMVVLLFIGDNLERAINKWKYIIIYFGSGILAGIASMGYNMLKNENTISIGASGAIFGVVGAMVYIVAINKGRLENISTRQIILFVIFSLYGGLTSQGVDNAAHIGGLLAGLLLAAILYKKPKKKQPERGY